MRIRLSVKAERQQQVMQDLKEGKVEFLEEAEFVLTEAALQKEEEREESVAEMIICRNQREMVFLPYEEICYFESLGHEVYVNTKEQQYTVDRRIYQLEGELPEGNFVRISNSIIIQKNAISKIRPALSSKFILTLSNGAVVDVTRTYYYKFKEIYGI